MEKDLELKKTLSLDAQKTLSLPDAPAPVWQPGEVIDELYEVRSILGKGGFGAVHKVFHRGWGMDLAVKSLRADRLASPLARESFAQEANTWVGLGLHPHIVACYFVRVIGVPRIFIEHMAGGSLADWLAAGKLQDLPGALDAAIQIARALAYAHSKGLVHRDLKAGNCLLTPAGTLKVTDFGLAKISALEEEPPADRGARLARVKEATRTGRLGTPECMAPEQWTSPRDAGPAADAWAFGSLLYELCGGRKPFEMAEGEPADYFYARQLEGRWSYPKPVGLPEGLTSLILSCLLEDPARRPSDFNRIAARLEAEYALLTCKAYESEAIEDPPVRADTMVNQAASLADLGRGDEALKLLDAALKLDPVHSGAIYNQGILQGSALVEAEWLARLERCRAASAGDWTAAFLLGQARLWRGDKPGALKSLEEARTISKGNPLVLRALSRAESKAGEAPELFIAPPSGSESAALEGGAFKSLMRRAETEFAQGRNAAAYEAVTKARGVKGYERAREALDLLKRLGAKGLRSGLRGAWQTALLEGSQGALALSADGVAQIRCQTSEGGFALEAAGSALRIVAEAEGKVLGLFEGHAAPIVSVALCADGGTAYTAGADGVRVWELEWELIFPETQADRRRALVGLRKRNAPAINAGRKALLPLALCAGAIGSFLKVQWDQGAKKEAAARLLREAGRFQTDNSASQGIAQGLSAGSLELVRNANPGAARVIPEVSRPDLDGPWSGEQINPTGAYTFTAVLAFAGFRLTGTITWGKKSDGLIGQLGPGGAVSFQRGDGVNSFVRYQGILSPDGKRIEGTFGTSKGNSGTFWMRR